MGFSNGQDPTDRYQFRQTALSSAEGGVGTVCCAGDASQKVLGQGGGEKAAIERRSSHLTGRALCRGPGTGPMGM